jgi:hypothetical protein
MGSEPAVHIAVRVNDEAPTVFSTALNAWENERLWLWIEEHPELYELVRLARELAEAGSDESGAAA